MYFSSSIDRKSCCVSLFSSASFPFIEEQRNLASLAVVLAFDKVKVLSPLMNCALIKSVNMMKHSIAKHTILRRQIKLSFVRMRSLLTTWKVQIRFCQERHCSGGNFFKNTFFYENNLIKQHEAHFFSKLKKKSSLSIKN